MATSKEKKLHKWKDVRARTFTPEEIAASQDWVQRETLEMNLRAVRELAGKTQKDVEAVTGMAQAEVSRAERRSDHLISTLRAYVEALGGRLDVFAVFDDKQVRLKGVTSTVVHAPDR